jgi:hypothetical protein
MPWARRYIVLSRCLFIRYDTSTACWAGGWTWIGATRDRRRRRQLHSIQKSSPRENGPQEVEVKVKERKKGKKRKKCMRPRVSFLGKKKTNKHPTPKQAHGLGLFISHLGFVAAATDLLSRTFSPCCFCLSSTYQTSGS